MFITHHPVMFKTSLSFPLGCMPNITRNAIVNCAELVTYDMIKELILKYDLMTGEVLKQSSCKTTDIQFLTRPNIVEGCDSASVSLQTICRATSLPPSVLASAQQ